MFSILAYTCLVYSVGHCSHRPKIKNPLAINFSKLAISSSDDSEWMILRITNSNYYKKSEIWGSLSPFLLALDQGNILLKWTYRTNRITKLCYSYVEWTVAEIEPRTFRSLPTELTGHNDNYDSIWCDCLLFCLLITLVSVVCQRYKLTEYLVSSESDIVSQSDQVTFASARFFNWTMSPRPGKLIY